MRSWQILRRVSFAIVNNLHSQIVFESKNSHHHIHKCNRIRRMKPHWWRERRAMVDNVHLNDSRVSCNANDQDEHSVDAVRSIHKHFEYDRLSSVSVLTNSRDQIYKWSHNQNIQQTNNRKRMTYLFFKCCTLPMHWKRPFAMIPIRLHRPSHSSILKMKGIIYRHLTINIYLCDVMIIVRCWRRNCAIKFHINCCDVGSIPADGSS